MKIAITVMMNDLRYLTNLRILFFVFLLSFFPITTCLAQIEISGIISDIKNKPIENASIIINLIDDTAIKGYAYSQSEGSYLLNTSVSEDFNITFSSLGYKSKTVTIRFNTIQDGKLTLNTSLTEETVALDQVILHVDRPIMVKKDTIVFKTKSFTDGTEQTVEDLLKKIPGIQVDSEGVIKVGNQEIEKLMVDGDDFFDRGYKILSKNMPAHPIEEIELLKNFSNNKLLKGIEESDKVALNLKLDEESKRIWFGNIESNVGNDKLYHLKSNLMNFGKKNKFYFLTNFNNMGYNATGDIQSLIRPFRFNEPESIGDNQAVNSLINLSPNRLYFKDEISNFNNAKLISLNAIFNPTEKLKLKTLGFLNWDNIDFFRLSENTVDANGVNFTNTEDYQLHNKKKHAFVNLNLTYDISRNQTLEVITKYNNADNKDGSTLIFNGKSTIESLEHQNTFFDQKISYTNKFKDKNVILITGRFIDEKVPENYKLNRFFYQDLFPNLNDANNVAQVNSNHMKFVGVNAHLLNRNKNGHLLELQIGDEFRKDKLNTNFSILKDDTNLVQASAYQNQTYYQVNDLYLKSKYRLSINDFGVTGKIDFHQLSNRLEDNGTSKEQSLFFINPSFGVDWEINDKNKIKANYSYNTTNAKILDVYSEFVLTGYRSFSKNTNNFKHLNASNFIVNYELGNWDERFFVNTFLMYTKNHDFFSTNTIIEQNYTQSEKILIKNRETISVNSTLDYYFSSIYSNLKLNLGYSKSEYKNIVNNSDLRLIKSNNYNYGLALRSSFGGIFNYHIGTRWTTSKIKSNLKNSYTNNLSFIDLFFVFNKKFDIDVQSERYYFRELKKDNTYYFLDFNVRYKLIEDKLTIGLTGKNLLNTKKFKNFSISDIGTSTTEYRLLPRIILLKLEYRF